VYRKMIIARFRFALFLIALFSIIAAVFHQISQGTEQAITLLVALLVGWIGMPLINYLKEKFGLEDQMALLFVYVISGGVGALGVLISGQFFAIEWSWNNVIAIAGVFLAAAKFAYERMKAKN
jgi:hypothetical protein